jgi:Bacterial regulatory protein, Fis family
MQDGGRGATTSSDGSTTTGWHESIRQFKRALLAQALGRANGNRTHAARALGLQRTYLLRLIRDLGVEIPPAHRRRHARDGASEVTMATTQPSPSLFPGQATVIPTLSHQGWVRDGAVR